MAVQGDWVQTQFLWIHHITQLAEEESNASLSEWI